jgi:PPOX class probable F420-dependent enzyme
MLAPNAALPPEGDLPPMKTNLGPDDLGDLLEQPIIGVLATRRPDDTILLSPVWFDWRDGAFSIWADSEQNGKVRHIRRDPRVSFVVANAEWPYKGLEVRGNATITVDDFYGVLGRTARRYMGAESEERMLASTPPGVVIRIEPSVVRGWDYIDEA